MAKYTDKHSIIGIPDKTVTQPIPERTHGIDTTDKEWEFVLQEHKAKRAGLHFDLRLGDPEKGTGHSWAIRRWPEPGEKVLAVQQPTHTLGYFDFSGKIESGYGAGEVKTSKRSKTEIVESSDNKIKFALYPGSGPEEYNLIRTKDNHWLLLNSTPTRQSRGDLPTDKVKMNDLSPAKLSLDDPTQIMTAKLDGAHSLFLIEPRKPIKTFSYRTSKRNPTGLIEHSQKVPILYNQKGPDKLGTTILRGELWAKSPKTGKPLPAAIIGGMVNANVWKSRENQKKFGDLIPSPFDLVYYDGKPVADRPYSEKLEMLKRVEHVIPGFVPPAMALTPGQKRELIEDIEAGNHGQTKEGVVMYDLQRHAPPMRVKFKHTTDVVLLGFFPGKGKYEDNGVGGFYYAYEDNPTKIIGRVGTGLNDSLRRDMYKNPQKYIGMVAKVEGAEIYKKDGNMGAIQKPVFKEWHIDKDFRDMIKKDLLKGYGV